MSNTITNTYDPLARRALESAELGGAADGTMQYVYGGASLWGVLERIELDLGSSGAEQLATSHVYGLGIDDEVSYRIENVASPEDFWTHRDDLGSLTSITDDAGLVVERYEYGDYGRVTIFDINGDVLPSSQYAAVHLYTGRSLIAGTGLYDYRFRVMDPWTGRFNQRDPLWYIDSMNVYAYVVSSPFVWVDPSGMGKVGWFETSRMIFTDKSVRDAFLDGAKDGAMATVDGFIPFADPFASRGMYDHCDPLLQVSQIMGGVARDALLAAIVPNIGTWVKNPVLYELGSKTIPATKFAQIQKLGAVERGRHLVTNGGLVRTIAPSINPALYGPTIGTGLTPGGWLLVIGTVHGVDSYTR